MSHCDIVVGQSIPPVESTIENYRFLSFSELFEVNKKYRNKIELHTLHNFVPVQFTHVMSFQKPNSSKEELNGKYTLMFFDNDKRVAYFSGMFVNGKAHGEGVMVIPVNPKSDKTRPPKSSYSWMDPFPLFGEQKKVNLEKIEHHVSAGHWINGSFTSDIKEIRSSLYGSVMSIIGDTLGMKCDTATLIITPYVNMHFSDPIDRSTNNCYEIRAKVEWQNEESETKRWLHFRNFTVDFIDSEPRVRIFALDNSSMPIYQSRNRSHLVGGFPKGDFMTSLFGHSGASQLINDHMLVRVSPWSTLHTTYCSTINETFDDYHKVIDISIRERRNLPWRHIKRLEVGSLTDCSLMAYDDARLPVALKLGNVQSLVEYTRSSFEGDYEIIQHSDITKGLFRNYYVFELSGQSYDQLVRNAITDVQTKFPSPLNDTTKADNAPSAQEKIKVLMERAKLLNAAEGNHPMSGAWLAKYDKDLNDSTYYLIMALNEATNDCLVLPINSTTINSNKGYHKSLYKGQLTDVGNMIILSYSIKNKSTLDSQDYVFMSDVRSRSDKLVVGGYLAMPNIYCHWHNLSKMTNQEIQDLINKELNFIK